MKQKQVFSGKHSHSDAKEQSNAQTLRQYAAPRVVSAEDLEAMAASCDPLGVGSNGKSTDVGCGTDSKPLGT